MKPAIELISYSATQPNTGLAAAAVTGDSLVVKNSTNPRILNFWGNNQVAGWHQIVYGSAGNTTRGIGRYAVDVLDPQLRLAPILGANIQSLETMSATIAGSNTAGDVETGTILMGYDHLPGVEQRLISIAEYKKRDAGKPDSISATLTGAAAGYTGEELFTAETDLLVAGYDYAVMGMSTNENCGAVYIVGPDTGNLRVGVPGDATNAEFTASFFLRMSGLYDMPMIPVISSDNKANSRIGFLQNENNITPYVTIHLARLKK